MRTLQCLVVLALGSTEKGERRKEDTVVPGDATCSALLELTFTVRICSSLGI